MKFYDDYAKQREHFEIIAFNLDDDVDSMRSLDAKLAPIVERVWKGRQLPFPSLVDAKSTTMENYGVGGFPTVILINPQGKVVKDGSLQLLKRELDSVKRVSDRTNAK